MADSCARNLPYFFTKSVISQGTRLSKILVSKDLTYRKTMANCPNCGSDHIQLKKETNVNWGRAAAGWALFGVVGGAVGSVTGEDRNVNACLD